MKNLFSRLFPKGKSSDAEPVLNKKDVPFRFDNSPDNNLIPFVDFLKDDELVELNNLLDWNAFILDAHGRRFGILPGLRKGKHPSLFRIPGTLYFPKE